MKTLRVLGGYARRHWLAWTAGWSFALSIYVSRIVLPLVGLALWTKALPGNGNVAAYYVALLFAVMSTDSPENHTFAQRVYDGSFTDDLLRPHPVPLHAIGFNLAFKAFNVLGAIPLGIVVALLVRPDLQLPRVLIAVPAVILGSSIAFMLSFIAAQSSFWTPRVHAVSQANSSLVFLLGGGAAPIPLMPASVRSWLEVLPWRMVNGFPSEVASGLTTGSDIVIGFGLQLLWLGVL
ncbi:MAG: ABC-2 family transporter protein, partial [Actinomycetota bacterium]